jgi:ribonuclease III
MSCYRASPVGAMVSPNEHKSTASRAIVLIKDKTELEVRLRYTFGNRALLREALTHASARAGRQIGLDNERLEFLGDRVLGVAIAEFLLETCPTAKEGELARRYNKLVCKEACANVARQIELGSFILMSEGEAGAGGRDKSTILADACEALLGALFLDGGLAPASRLIREYWGPRLRVSDAAPLDAKTALQEWAQARKLDLPRYFEVSAVGPDHAPSFTAEVRIDGLPPARGEGPSKRAAEQAAASAMLLREGVWLQAAEDH